MTGTNKPFSGCYLELSDEQKQVLTKREQVLYTRPEEYRSDFERDYTRILHSTAYRRLKHKTQVFFNIDNDHICTRMEHVQHVESVSCTIAGQLGLNVELVKAIALGHDLGHSPFGHEGEIELTNIRKENGLDKFWHERNSLRVVDSIDLIEDNRGVLQNLNLTYAVRDGIICHCGEVSQNALKPRTEAIDLYSITTPGLVQPFTWEGCVVKLSDKIAYLGRDIEDALCLGFLSDKDMDELKAIARKNNAEKMNTTVIIHELIANVCSNSNPEAGIIFDDVHFKMIEDIKEFNYKKIYKNERFETYREYVKLIIRSIYNLLIEQYDGEKTFDKLEGIRKYYPQLVQEFSNFLCQRSACSAGDHSLNNNKIYGDLSDRIKYVEAIIDYISGMTDRFAITVFNEMISFRMF